MIYAKELRIGNWVQICHDGEEGWFEVKVTDTHLDNTIDTDFHDKSVRLYFFEPIPLTRDILKNCDAEYSTIIGWNFYFEKLYKRINIVIDLKEVRIVMPHFNGVMTICNTMEYLHQLQNLIFSLTNTELNYKP